jgi:hypothetical protein
LGSPFLDCHGRGGTYRVNNEDCLSSSVLEDGFMADLLLVLRTRSEGEEGPDAGSARPPRPPPLCGSCCCWWWCCWAALGALVGTLDVVFATATSSAIQFPLI